MATQEILDELRPKICPTDWNFGDIIKMFKLFLPVKLPPDLHNQGFKFVSFFSRVYHMLVFRLWLSEFFCIWESIYNQAVCENVSFFFIDCVYYY
jgi:hypothetical protein